MKPFAILKREIVFYRNVIRDPRTPAIARWCVRAAAAYLLSPIDLIPDFVPVLGQLDDVIIVSLLLAIARYFVPADVLQEHRPAIRTSCREASGTGVDADRRADRIPLNDDQDAAAKEIRN